jgi:hypothetical protein
MAKVIESKNKLLLELSFWERIFAFQKSLSMDKSLLVEKNWSIIHGVPLYLGGLELPA